MTIVNAALFFVFFVTLMLFSQTAAAQKVAQSSQGMAATTSPYATQAAARILASGGAAADAAAAAHFALMVADAPNASLGGRAQILARRKDGALFEIDGATEAPSGVGRLPEAERQGYAVAPIPGNLAALDLLIRRHGRLTLSAVLQPAIVLAEDGFDVTPGVARTWAGAASYLLRNPGAAAFLTADRAPYTAGARFRQLALARTLQEIARFGPSVFYRGSIAEAVERDVRKGGGFIVKKDLEQYRALDGEVVRTSYRGYEVASAGGRAWGDTLVEMLNIAERFSFSREQSAGDINTLARIMSAALEDRPQELNTLKPKKNGYALATISSREFAAKRAEAIRLKLSSPPAASAEQTRVELHDTTHLAVMD